MVKVEAIVREENYEDVKDALSEIDVHGVTISQVMGCGWQKGYHSFVRGSEVDINLLPKLKFEVVLASEEWVEKTIEAISKAAYSGKNGDGKIFVYEIRDAIRIRTGERGEAAIHESGVKVESKQ